MLSAWIRIVIVPVLAGLLYVLPLRMTPRQLLTGAFGLWLLGGASLMVSGLQRLVSAALSEPAWLVGLVVGLAAMLGVAKGAFVLSKTSARNIERIQAFNAPQRAVCVYSLKSWLLIELMLVFSASLTWLGAPDLWRGAINLAVGLALVASSLRYGQRLRA